LAANGASIIGMGLDAPRGLNRAMRVEKGHVGVIIIDVGSASLKMINARGKSMKDQWENELSCAIACNRCNTNLAARDQRILSVFDHQPICLACKQAEEKQPDYAEASKK
jgi:hypothetical protein